MGHTVPAAVGSALSKRQRKKAFKVQPELPATQSAHGCDQLEPHICSQQLNTSRLFRDGAAQASAPNKPEASAGYPVLCSSQLCSHSSIDQAAAVTAQSLVIRPALGLTAPSTAWLSDSAKVEDRIRLLLSTYGAMQVSQDLQTIGYPKVVCQRACLEAHLISKHVDVDACVKWIKQQADISGLNRPVNALELLKYQDLSKAVTNLLHRVPGIHQQTAQIAIQQTLGDEDVAAAFLTAALSETHMPSSGDPNTMASLLLQNLPPGFNLPANSGEVVQAMAAAMAKASELQLATDRLAVAAMQSQQQIKAAMASGQLDCVTSPDMLQSTTTSQLALHPPPAPAKAGSVSAAADLPTDRQAIEEKLQILETHKDWADKKIGQLIKRVTDAERPQKDEAYRLRDEVLKLRNEKDLLEGKLKEFERSLQKLKDCTYQEATQKREYERRMQAVQADLRGAHLREQELQHQMEHEAASARSEHKKREHAERMCRQAVEDKASITSMLAEQQQDVRQVQAGARRQDRLAEERLRRAEDQIASMAQARQEVDHKCEVLSVEKASMASGLEAKDAQMERMQQEHSNVQTQLLLCQERVSQLQSEVMQVQQALAVKDQQKSFYSHWNGSSIQFLDQTETRSPASTSPPTPLALHPQPPTSQRSSQDSVRTFGSVSSPARPASTHPSQQNFVSFPADSFASPTQRRAARQGDQPASLLQSRLGGASPVHHSSSNSQSPVGSRVMHRKSCSMDSRRVPSPCPSNGFGHGKAGGVSGVMNGGGKPSPRSQHGSAGASQDGPIASLLGLNQNGAVDPIFPDGRGHRSLRPTKSLHSTRSDLRASANDFDPSHLLPRAIHDLTIGSGSGMSMVQPAHYNGHQTNQGNGKNVGYAASQDFAQRADAFQRQLRVSSSAQINI